MGKLFFISIGCGIISSLSILSLGIDHPLLAQTEERAREERLAQQRDRVTNRRRVALVIGNADYQTGAPLRNPVNDATDIAATLQELGFNKVISVTNANLRKMESALNEFARELNSGSIGVFYYAGHGMQSQGENYLIPVDAEIQSESDIRYESLPLGKVLGRLEDADNPVNIVILDACRDNPFSRGWRSSGSQGLAEVRAEGMLIAYATAPGDVASDGEGRNGTFTGALLQGMQTPGQDIVLMMRDVRRIVKRQTGGRQIPWVSTSLDNNFAFLPSAPSSPPNPPITASPPNSDPSPPALNSEASQSNSPLADDSRQPSDRLVSFAQSPRLLDARTTRNVTGVRGAKHYFTLTLPNNAGVSLQSVEIKQHQSTNQIEYNLEDTIAFIGKKRNSGTALTIENVSLDESTQRITVTLADSVTPGTTFTIGLFPERNPRSSGSYLFDVTAVPKGKNPLPLNLGVARFQFRENDVFF